MNIQQTVAQIANHIQRHRRIIYKCPRLATVRQLATNSAFLACIIQIVLTEKAIQMFVIRNIKLSLNYTLLCINFNRFTIGPLTQNKRKST